MGTEVDKLLVTILNTIHYLIAVFLLLSYRTGGDFAEEEEEEEGEEFIQVTTYLVAILILEHFCRLLRSTEKLRRGGLWTV
jgi:hypothetical protein